MKKRPLLLLIFILLVAGLPAQNKKSKALILQADKAYHEGAYERSIDYCEQALKKDSKCSYALFLTGLDYSRLHKEEQALQNYREYLKQKPDDHIGWYDVGQCELNLQNYPEAFTAFDRSIALEANFYQAWRGRGAAEAMMARYTDGENDCQHAVNMEYYDDTVYYYLALCQFNLKEFTKAYGNIKRSIQINPTLAPSLQLLGDCELSFQHYDEALKQYSAALAIDSSLYYSHLNRALICRRAANEEMALMDYNSAVRQFPDSVAPRFDRGLLYIETKQFDKAQADMQFAVSRLPNDPVVLINYARLHYLTGQFQQGLDEADKAISIMGDSAIYYSLRAGIKGRMQNYDGALRDYSKAISMNETADSYAGRGAVYISLEQFDSAYSDLHKALQLDSVNEVALGSICYMLVIRGEKKEAMHDAILLTTIDSAKSYPWLNRGLTEFYLQKFDDAVRSFTRSLQIDPDQGQVYYYRGMSYFSQKNYAASKKDLAKALEFEPDNAKWRSAYAEVKDL